jgi:hypothetical protein
VLEEIPRQFISYMERNKIVPKSVHEEEKKQMAMRLKSQVSVRTNNSLIKD